MSYDFTPMSEEEIRVSSLVPDGLYPYQVIKTEERISQKTGNPYISLTLRIWDEQGREHMVFTNMCLIKLLKHFCDANNMQNEYMSGNIEHDVFMNKSGGLVLIGIEPEKTAPNGTVYKTKNIVKDYVVEAKQSALQPFATTLASPFQTTKAIDEFINDSIPF